MLLHDARDPKQVATYLAERAQIIKQGDAAYLRMEKGNILRRNNNETAPQIIAFTEYVVDFNQLEQRADQAQIDPPARTLYARPHLAGPERCRRTNRLPAG